MLDDDAFSCDPVILRSDAAVPRRPLRANGAPLGSARLAALVEVEAATRAARTDPHGTVLAGASILAERDGERAALEAAYSAGLGWTEEQLNAHVIVVGPPAQELASFARGRDVLTGGVRKLAAWIAANDHAERLRSLVEFVGTGSQNAYTVLADMRMRLAPFEDEQVREVTSSDALDLEAVLVERAGVLLIEMDEAHDSALRPVCSLFFSRLFVALLDAAGAPPGGRLPRPVSVHMDTRRTA
jgi:hypothetical protein